MGLFRRRAHPENPLFKSVDKLVLQDNHARKEVEKRREKKRLDEQAEKIVKQVLKD